MRVNKKILAKVTIWVVSTAFPSRKASSCLVFVRRRILSFSIKIMQSRQPVRPVTITSAARIIITAAMTTLSVAIELLGPLES